MYNKLSNGIFFRLNPKNQNQGKLFIKSKTFKNGDPAKWMDYKQVFISGNDAGCIF